MTATEDAAIRLQAAAEDARLAAERTCATLEYQLATARAANAELQREREALTLAVGALEERLAAAKKDAAIWLASAKGGAQDAEEQRHRADAAEARVAELEARLAPEA